MKSSTTAKGILASLVLLLLLGGNVAFASPSTQALTITVGGTVQDAGDQKYKIHGGSIVSATVLGQGLTTTASAAAASTQGYVPITLTNNQGSATPTGLQEKITWNPSTYSTYEATDLGNIRFCSDSLCNSPLYAWLESCAPSCSPSASSAIAWVKLASPIAGSGGSLKIYMVFVSASTGFDARYWGEAPNLSGSYGAFDNGASVFNFYDNFAGSSLSNKWTAIKSSGGSVTVNNGAKFTSSAGSDWAFVVAPPQAYPQVAEAYMVSSSGGGTNPVMGVTTSASTNNWIDPYKGYEVDQYSSTMQFVTSSSGGGTALTTPEPFQAGIWQLIWSATGSESGSDGVKTLTSTDNSNSIANYGIFIGQSNYVAGNNVADWGRMRAYPPGNVMPSASFESPAKPSSPATTLPSMSFNLRAEANGLSANGNAQFQASGWTASGAPVQLQGQAQIVGMQSQSLPIGCTTACTSGIPVFFVGVATTNITIGSSPTQHITSTMLFESPYFNPWGNPIMIVSTDGAIVIATTYDKATLDWKGTTVSGTIRGSLGNSPVRGTMALTSNEHEDFVTGVTTYDNGTMSFTNMSPRSLNVQGTYQGTSTIPKPGTLACAATQALYSTPCSQDCSSSFGSWGLPVIPGTCTQTGFQSSGQFSLLGQRTDDGATQTTTVSGSYSTIWSAPALGFATLATATVTQ